MNLSGKQLCRPLLAALALAGLHGAPLAAEKWQQTITCEKQSISMQVVSLKRMGAGQLDLTMQVENTANVPYKLGSPAQLVDDQGEQWAYDRGSVVQKVFQPNVKTNLVLHFSRSVGGNGAKSANLTFNALIGSPTQAKNYGKCLWQVAQIPIQ